MEAESVNAIENNSNIPVSRSQNFDGQNSSASSSSSTSGAHSSGNDIISLVDKFVDVCTKDPVRIRRLIASLGDKQQRLLGSVVIDSPSTNILVCSGDSWMQEESQPSGFVSTGTGPQESSHSPPTTNISASLASVASSTGGGSNEGENLPKTAPAATSTTANTNSFLTATKLSRLEAERNDLLMQVSVLTAQVSAQQDKITELEATPPPPPSAPSNSTLNGSQKLQLNGSAEINGSSNGGASAQHRLDLLSEISTLKVRLAGAENAIRDWEAKYSALQKISTNQQLQLKERDLQIADLRNRLMRQQQVPDAAYEIDRLRRAVDSLLTSNVDKERKIDELNASLVRYRRMFDSAVEDAAFSDTASAKSLNIARYMGAGNGQQTLPPNPIAHQQQQGGGPIYARPSLGHNNNVSNSQYAPIGDSVSLSGDGSYASATFPYPRTSSRSEQYSVVNGTASRPPSVMRQGPIPPMQDSSGMMPAQAVTPLVMHQQNMNSSAPSHVEDDSAGEMSDVVYDDVGHHGLHQLHSRNGPGSRSLRVSSRPDGDSYWGQHQPRSSQHHQPHYSSSSVTDTVFDENLPSMRSKKGSTAKLDEDQRRVDEAVSEYKQRLDHSNSSATSIKSATSKLTSGISRFLGLGSSKKSKTVDAEEVGVSYGSDTFVRGGVRATVGGTGTVPRRYVAPTYPNAASTHNLASVPPRMWDAEMVGRWLADLGLQQYIGEARRSVQNGDRLLQLTSSDFEKELGVKNSLHAKKLQIAISRLRAIQAGQVDMMEHPSAKLHSALVLRWLDDIGLPQLKDVFVECQIDGAVLNVLSLEDLSQLRIASRLHALSIRWGITALRAANFDLNKYIRRPPQELQRQQQQQQEDDSELLPGQDPPCRVLFWTCHRVMDWLRSVDLAEYAANVRGSGLHGAVMLLESTFTAESLAAILQIPTNRSLLRRHLAQKFDQLVGQAAAEAKSATAQTDVLLPSTKLKIKKSSQKTSLFGSKSHSISTQPPLTVDVFTTSSNSSLNCTLLSSPSVDGKILSNLVGGGADGAPSSSSGVSSKRNSPPNIITQDPASGSSTSNSTVMPPDQSDQSNNSAPSHPAIDNSLTAF